FNRAINKIWIKIMNKDKKNYNKLKKYCKLLLKDSSKIGRVKFHYHQSFKKQMREQVSEYMKTSIKTMKKYIDYVENTMKYSYTNGVIEEINNKIKVIKRIAFG